MRRWKIPPAYTLGEYRCTTAAGDGVVLATAPFAIVRHPLPEDLVLQLRADRFFAAPATRCGQRR